jgi:hypothetical protein
MNINMFMSLVRVLFGSKYDYYKGLRNVYAMPELKEVMVQENRFMAKQRRRITWTILNDGQAHFDNIKTRLDFRGPDKPVWPQSYLIDILHNVRYAIAVDCVNFLEE